MAYGSESAVPSMSEAMILKIPAAKKERKRAKRR
jgi:hypothetical protein